MKLCVTLYKDYKIPPFCLSIKKTLMSWKSSLFQNLPKGSKRLGVFLGLGNSKDDCKLQNFFSCPQSRLQGWLYLVSEWMSEL